MLLLARVSVYTKPFSTFGSSVNSLEHLPTRPRVHRCWSTAVRIPCRGKKTPALCIVAALLNCIQPVPVVTQFDQIQHTGSISLARHPVSCETKGHEDTTHTGQAGEARALHRLRREPLWRPVYPRTARSTIEDSRRLRGEPPGPHKTRGTNWKAAVLFAT